MNSILIAFAFFFLMFNQAYSSTDSLKKEIEEYLKGKKAKVGVAVKDLETGESFSINDNNRYPMQSVYKFHLALAVLDKVDKGKLSLNQMVKISKKDLLPDTWSPLRDKYPEGIALPLKEVIAYTVAQSDNNGCDILFKLIGKPSKVNQYIKKLGIKDISIRSTEAEMHADYKLQFENWTKPSAAVALLEKLYKKEILSDSCRQFLMATMINTSTGPNKLKGMLPKETQVAHKTGLSGKNEEGITAASNDIGIVYLSNGGAYAIACFVSNSSETESVNEEIIARINKMVWDYLNAKRKRN